MTLRGATRHIAFFSDCYKQFQVGQVVAHTVCYHPSFCLRQKLGLLNPACRKGFGFQQ